MLAKLLPCEQSPLVFLLGRARRSERDSAELVYILCGADNPKTWIIMRNLKFDTGFITGLIRTGNYLLNLLLGNRQLLSNFRACSNECIHKFCRVSLASPCRAEKKYERTLLTGYKATNDIFDILPDTGTTYEAAVKCLSEYFSLSETKMSLFSNFVN